MTRAIALLLLLACSPALADNHAVEDLSFFPETAWNRNDSVLQFNTFVFGNRTGHDLTHEWATPSGRHQVSYTLPLYDEERPAFGDASLNYRYQLFGGTDSPLAVAPRVSLLLPTRTGDGAQRTTGFQLALPFSAAIGSRIESHTALGASWFTEGRDSEITAAQSFTFAATERLTLLFDTAWTRAAAGDSVTVVRPGIQYAFDAPGGLTVAPGIAFPNGGGALLFVALERPLRRGAR